MYLKLGTIKETYQKTEYDDFIIFSQIVDSQMSYETPILVRNITDLELWFGKDFPQRDYYEELLNYGGITLFLYKPVSSNKIQDLNGYLLNTKDIYFWDENKKLCIRNEETGKLEKSTLLHKIIYRVNETSGKFKDDITGFLYNKYIYWIGSNNSESDWNISEEEKDKVGIFVNIDDLPTTSAILNRDTLQINKIADPVKYSCPKYNPDVFGEIGGYSLFLSGLNKNSIISQGINYDRLEKKYQTYAFDINYTIRELEDNEYIIISTKEGKKKLICKNYELLSYLEGYYDEYVEKTTTNGIISDLLENGYILNGNILYSTFPVETTYFYNLKDFSLEPNLIESYNILQYLGDPHIRFWSKTIGPGGDDGYISISIENIDKQVCRIKVKRFNYEEVYEGTIKPEIGEERLDYIISKNSKLVYCKLEDEIDEPLQEGEWKMYGAIEEKLTGYNESMKEILEEESVKVDYFLIEDLKSYNNIDWKEILELSKNNGCQVLIQNNSEEEIKNNYTQDKENWLIYFYKGIQYQQEDRPGYYLYLKGLLEDIYSYETDKILYHSPITELYDNVNTELEKYKCNYLTDNGYKYYYRTYFDGNDYITTGWMRFVIGKISRELEKNKWTYLGERFSSKLQENIEKILRRINKSFGIIRYINLTDLTISQTTNSISLTLETSVSDVVKNDLTLDITVNFNK